MKRGLIDTKNLRKKFANARLKIERIAAAKLGFPGLPVLKIKFPYPAKSRFIIVKMIQHFPIWVRIYSSRIKSNPNIHTEYKIQKDAIICGKRTDLEKDSSGKRNLDNIQKDYRPIDEILMKTGHKLGRWIQRLVKG